MATKEELECKLNNLKAEVTKVEKQLEDLNNPPLRVGDIVLSEYGKGAKRFVCKNSEGRLIAQDITGTTVDPYFIGVKGYYKVIGNVFDEK